VFPSGIVVANPGDEFASAEQEFACPVCRQTGHVHAEVFGFLGQVIELLSAPERTHAELTRLAEILTEATQQRQSAEAMVARFEDELPELSGVAALIVAAPSRLYSYASMAVAVSVLIWQAKSGTATSELTVEYALNQIYREMNRSAESLGFHLKPQARRNEPCPCGSGKKFKHCCGRLAQGQL
jgi:hypothetical protein